MAPTILSPEEVLFSTYASPPFVETRNDIVDETDDIVTNIVYEGHESSQCHTRQETNVQGQGVTRKLIALVRLKLLCFQQRNVTTSVFWQGIEGNNQVHG